MGARLLTLIVLGFGIQSLPAADPPPTRCEQTDDAIVLYQQGRPVLKYNIKTVEPPEDVPSLFRRSGHIHPVWSPSGKEVTSEFPADHLHQHGVFRAWVNTTFDGRKIDFWNQRAQTGLVEHVQVAETSSDEGAASMTVELRHSDITDPENKIPVLKELWTIRTVDWAPGSAFDIISRQTCIAGKPLTINEYHYGGMAFRGNDQWLNQPEHDFLTSEGKHRKEGNHTRPQWVTASGEIDGELCSITIMGHPSNFRYPEPVRLHPSKPYFVFTPPFLGEFELKPDEEHVARYRFLVQDGRPQKETIERAWEVFRNER